MYNSNKQINHSVNLSRILWSRNIFLCLFALFYCHCCCAILTWSKQTQCLMASAIQLKSWPVHIGVTAVIILLSIK